jgi:hypothetical protein
MADPSRWCVFCQAWGDHHTDRCPETSHLCDYCDDYHPVFVNCPHMDPERPFRRTTEQEEEEMDRAAYARHDRRLFG